MKKLNHKKSSKKKLSGGAPGTSGNVDTLVDDLFGLVENIVKTVVNTTEFVVDVIELPGDLGTPYKEKAAPGIELV